MGQLDSSRADRGKGRKIDVINGCRLPHPGISEGSKNQGPLGLSSSTTFRIHFACFSQSCGGTLALKVFHKIDTKENAFPGPGCSKAD